LDGAFCDQIHVLVCRFCDFVKQFVQGDKVAPFHVPMRLLCLMEQIYGVGESRVQYRDHAGARLCRQIVLGVMQRVCVSEFAFVRDDFHMVGCLRFVIR
jgi:hypothetical protein